MKKLTLILVLMATSAGCNTPQSICNDTITALDDLGARCGYAPIELTLDTGEPATCDDVNTVDNPSQLLNECIPWAEEATCDELDTLSRLTDVGCDFRLFGYYPPEG